MFYTIYETTNLLNGKKYIGKHVTKDLNDGYLGSGLLLLKSINKHGKQNFTKKILYIFDNEEEMNAKEVELVNEHVILSPDYYNIALGGQGGVIVLKEGHPLYESTKNKLKSAQQKRKNESSLITKENHRKKTVGMYGKKQSDHQKKIVSELMRGVKKSKETVEKHKEAMRKTFNTPGYVHPNKGIKRGPGHKEKMSEIIKNRPPKTCPHCNKTMNAGNYGRYHGDKCKSRTHDEHK
jgi:hypothetical protein